MPNSLPLTGLAVVAAVAAGLGAARAFDRQGWARDVPAEVARGHQVYAAACASCHGAALEGQPRWWEPGPDGMLPAPPHDATGHTWQHSDRELTELVLHSVTAFAPAGYRTGMPAFAGRLSEAQVAAVIAYIKSTWAPGIRAYQAAQNPGGPTLQDLGSDWLFPATCGYHLGPPQGSAQGPAQ